MKLKDFRMKLNDVVEGLVSKDLLLAVGQDARQMVKDRTRKGFGVEKNLEPATKLPGISESYKKQRARLKRKGKLSADTTPNKSNMTKSGELLDTIDIKVGTNSVTIGPKGEKNRKKAKYNAENNRTVFNLSKKENKKINQIVQTKIANDIKKQGL